MIDVQEFLLNKHIKAGAYALVKYNNKIELIWFTKYNDWFLESPCQLYKIMKINEPIDKFCKKYAEEMLEEDVDKEYYIEQHIKPMIINNTLYEIENFQCSPYLPTRVNDIKLITERQCLEYMLRRKGIDK